MSSSAMPTVVEVVEPEDPIFVSAHDAATLLGLSRAQTYALLDKGVIESRYYGRRRLVVLGSLREFADSLPNERAS